MNEPRKESVFSTITKSEHFVPIAFLFGTFILFQFALWFLARRYKKFFVYRLNVTQKARASLEDPGLTVENKEKILKKYCLLQPDDDRCKGLSNWFRRNWPVIVGVIIGAIITWVGFAAMVAGGMILTGIILIVIGVLFAILLPLILELIVDWKRTRNLDEFLKSLQQGAPVQPPIPAPEQNTREQVRQIVEDMFVPGGVNLASPERDNIMQVNDGVVLRNVAGGQQAR